MMGLAESSAHFARRLLTMKDHDIFEGMVWINQALAEGATITEVKEVIGPEAIKRLRGWRRNWEGLWVCDDCGDVLKRINPIEIGSICMVCKGREMAGLPRIKDMAEPKRKAR